MTEQLSASELALGFVEFHCDAHGFLVATLPSASVYCRCGKRARRIRHGRLLDPQTLKPTSAKPRALNAAGHPFIHGCGDCGEDFGGRRLLGRHRAGSPNQKRCLSFDEMVARGWHRDARGRWRQRRDLASLSTAATSPTPDALFGDLTACEPLVGATTRPNGFRDVAG